MERANRRAAAYYWKSARWLSKPRKRGFSTDDPEKSLWIPDLGVPEQAPDTVDRVGRGFGQVLAERPLVPKTQCLVVFHGKLQLGFVSGHDRRLAHRRVLGF